MNSKKSILYLPVEISKRELDSKVLLALKAISKNFVVVIGRKSPLIEYIKKAPPGIFLSIWGAHKNFKKIYKDLNSYGHKIAVMDEEGLITLSYENYLRLKLDDLTLNYVDAFFTWGNYQNQKFVSSRFDHSKKFFPTGNPRIDLLHHKFNYLYHKDSEDIKKDHGNFFLIVSSFGFCNHYDGSKNYFEQLKNTGVIRDSKEELIYKEYLKFQSKNFEKFIFLIKSLSEKYKNVNFVYRKHPAENKKITEKIFKNHKNVILEDSKTITPWILSSLGVVHNYCTTAIEAQILKKPSIAYRPFISNSIESEIPYLCSNQNTNFDSLMSAVDLILQNGTLMNQDLSGLNKYIRFIDDFSASSEEIVNNLYTIAPKIDSNEINFKSKNNISFKNVIKKIIRKNDYISHKFGKTDLNTLSKTIKNISLALELDFNSLNIQKLSKDIFLIEDL